MSYGRDEMFFDALTYMKQTLNVLNARKSLHPHLEVEANRLNARIIELEKANKELP